MEPNIMTVLDLWRPQMLNQMTRSLFGIYDIIVGTSLFMPIDQLVEDNKTAKELEP